ncbi:hypothetical protein ACFLSY_06700, partial [Bacteroidota bacterium]
KWQATGPMKQGGRIESIVCPKGHTSTIYVGVGSGNLWKTINNGTTWKPVFDNESTFTIGSVAVAPSDPDIVWVGTGEILMARSSYAGTGVFKSTNAGESWENMGLTDSHHIGRVVIDPVNPDIVYVAAMGHLYSFNEERGLFKTIDGGKSWKNILYVSEKTGVVDVIMDPSDNNTLYAIAWERDRKVWGHVQTGMESAVYKSTDAGKSWEKLSGLPQGKDIGRFGIDVSKSNPNVVYAVVDNRTPVSGVGRGRNRSIGGEIYRSDNKGESWKKVNEGRLNTAIGYDFCLVRVSPDDENQVWVLGNNLLRSDDAGKTYKHIEGTLVHLQPHESTVLHLDMHEMWIDPLNSDRVLLGNDGGFHMSYDRGDSWLHFNNIPIGEFYAVSVDMDTPFNIYGGTQDDAALYGPSDFVMADDVTDPWTQIYVDRWGGGDSYFTWRDLEDKNIIYYEHQFGYLIRKNMKTKIGKNIQPKASGNEVALKYNWMTPFFISFYDPSTLYYGANKMFKSDDKGDNWVCISPDLSTQPGPEKQGNVPYGTITTISESVLKQGLLYVGTDDGNIQITKDDGKSWNLIDTGLPEKWCSRVIASQHNIATVYASFTGYREDDFEKYIYKSEDYGNTWKSIASNLPSEPINVIREDPKNPDLLYVGTDLGVYVSIDKGKSWISICNNLPTTPVYDLVIHPRDNKIVIGTHGRSTFVMDISSIQTYK